MALKMDKSGDIIGYCFMDGYIAGKDTEVGGVDLS